MTSIYKYTLYRPEFFDNFYLKISRFGEFNDPFEMVLGSYLASVSEEEHDEIMALSRTLSDGASYIDATWDAQCGVRAHVGVLCFASKENNLLMWSHYANNHAGLCIELDSTAHFFNGQYQNVHSKLFDNLDIEKRSGTQDQNIGVLKPVIYTVDRSVYIDPQELGYDTESWFIKSPEWAYEEEQRLLLPIDHAHRVEIEETVLYFYPIEPSLIKSVIVGCQMPVKEKREVYEKCQSLGIRVREAFVHAYQFKLDIVDYGVENHSGYINEFNLNRMTR